LSDEFDGRFLNPEGVLIDLPFRVFKHPKKLNLLERDRESGRRRIKVDVFGLMDLWGCPDFRHDRPVRGFDPAHERSQSPDSGCASALLSALGRDWPGATNSLSSIPRTCCAKRRKTKRYYRPMDGPDNYMIFRGSHLHFSVYLG